MQNKLLSHIAQHRLFDKKDCILVAVSGGVDSMVLLFLLREAGYEITIAHCNYQLRGQDSDADEMLVKNWAAENGVPFYSKKIDTKKRISEGNSSLQMVAREERYRFFEELMEKHNYTTTSLAHHANDRVETLIMNVLRGTGIRGLRGMPVKRDQYVRPLLFATKLEIRKFAKKQNIPFREDSSNATTNYKRNYVRLQLLPLLRNINLEVDSLLLTFSERVEKELPNYIKWVEKKKKELVSDNGISIQNLGKNPFPFTILKEILKPKGFSSNQIFQLLGILNSESGTVISNANFSLLKNRDKIIVSQIEQKDVKPTLFFKLLSRDEITDLKTPSNIIFIDAETVELNGKKSEFNMRKWKIGDRFKPFGMHGWKKLSDFFIDKKLSLMDKEKTRLLTYKEKIVWVIGMRMDDRFKITKKTKTVLKISLAAN